MDRMRTSDAGILSRRILDERGRAEALTASPQCALISRNPPSQMWRPRQEYRCDVPYLGPFGSQKRAPGATEKQRGTMRGLAVASWRLRVERWQLVDWTGECQGAQRRGNQAWERSRGPQDRQRGLANGAQNHPGHALSCQYSTEHLFYCQEGERRRKFAKIVSGNGRTW
jgi:hypothetical protein